MIGVVASSNNNGGSGGGSSETTTVTYHGNGGTCEGKETYQTTSTSIPYLTWSRSGYNPDGYTVSSDGTGTVYKYGDSAPKGVKDLYVKWVKANTLTVTVTDAPADIKISSNGTTVTSGTVLTDDSCTFAIDLENTIANKYKFSNLSSGTYLTESDVPVYKIEYSSVAYTGQAKTIIHSFDDDHTVMTIGVKNCQTLTITFTAVSS